VLKYQIEIVRPKYLKLVRTPRRRFHKENKLSFLNGLDSQFFESVGARIKCESQLDSRILASSKLVYDQVFAITLQTILEKGVTKITVPGGRTLIPNAVIAAAAHLEIPCTVLEQVTSKSTRYCEFQLDFRENMIPRQLDIDQNWAKGDLQKYEIAEKYIKSKLEGTQLGRNFSKHFDSSIEIPRPDNKKLAAIFVGSGFEMAPLGLKIANTQVGIQQEKRMLRIFIKVAQEHDFCVVLRGHPPHPGLEKMFAAEDQEWAQFCIENRIDHISSFSKIDSYKLLKLSDINVVYASTVGIDSIILGANTLVLANTDWAHLVPELCGFDEAAIRSRFNTFYKSVDIKSIYPYAYYMETGGIKMAKVECSKDGRLYFEGQEVGAHRFKLLEKIFKR
jgi:hypothetical protein